MLQNFSINLQQIINNPIQQSQWSQLQTISKLLNQYMQKCVKNRQYIEAQKAKDKIEEVYACIKRRNTTHIADKMVQNMKKLQAKHEEEKEMFYREWDMKIAIVEQKYHEALEKKAKQNEQQEKNLREQIELALPITHSPDDRLKSLRNEEKRLAEQGKFLQAQRVKDQIEHREQQLQQKHRKLREANIKSMIDQLKDKHERELKQRQKQKKTTMDEILVERNRKLKDLEQRQAKEIKQMKWIHSEEMRLKG